MTLVALPFGNEFFPSIFSFNCLTGGALNGPTRAYMSSNCTITRPAGGGMKLMRFSICLHVFTFYGWRHRCSHLQEVWVMHPFGRYLTECVVIDYTCNMRSYEVPMISADGAIYVSGWWRYTNLTPFAAASWQRMNAHTAIAISFTFQFECTNTVG